MYVFFSLFSLCFYMFAISFAEFAHAWCPEERLASEGIRHCDQGIKNYRLHGVQVVGVLCILISKRVLCMLFAGRNHFFGVLNVKAGFTVFFHHKCKKTQKYQKKHVIKGGLPAFRVISTMNLEFLLNAGWHPKAGQLQGKMWFFWIWFWILQI